MKTYTFFPIFISHFVIFQDSYGTLWIAQDQAASMGNSSLQFPESPNTE